MRSAARSIVLASTVAAAVACSRGPGTLSQPAPAPLHTEITASDLRQRLYAFSHDSMMGRAPGSEGNFKGTQWIASEFARVGLRPAGDLGGWYQTIPFVRIAVDPRARLELAGRYAAPWREWVLLNQTARTRAVDGVRAVYGGRLSDSTTWPAADSARGRFVIMEPQNGAAGRATIGALRATMRTTTFAGAAALAVVGLDAISDEQRDQLRGGSLLLAETPATDQPGLLLVSRAFADSALGATGYRRGIAGQVVRGGYGVRRDGTEYPVRNVVAILEGSDPALKGEYISITAHNDHVGFGHAPVDHDSIRAYNRVVRPLGADSPERAATAEEKTRIRALLDSLRGEHRARADSIRNGADDDGSGTVALLEIAEAMAGAKERPRRSILFVSHNAEEYGLLGSRWFTDHPTVPRDSIVVEMDMDMIGRGGKSDLPEGGPGYLERVGTRRISREFGDIIDAVNARQPAPFSFNDAFDAPGHPMQYYCRADHYSYARYGIPSVAFSRGEHLDYHQVTDEPQYIDYDALQRVASFVRDAALTIANLDHRVVRDSPAGDPRAPCRQ